MTRTQKQRKLDAMVGRYVMRMGGRYVTPRIVDAIWGSQKNWSAAFTKQIHRAWSFEDVESAKNIIYFTHSSVTYDVFYVANADPLITIPILTE